MLWGRLWRLQRCVGDDCTVCDSSTARSLVIFGDQVSLGRWQLLGGDSYDAGDCMNCMDCSAEKNGWRWMGGGGGVTVMLSVIAEIRGCQPTNPPPRSGKYKEKYKDKCKDKCKDKDKFKDKYKYKDKDKDCRDRRMPTKAGLQQEDIH